MFWISVAMASVGSAVLFYGVVHLVVTPDVWGSIIIICSGGTLLGAGLAVLHDMNKARKKMLAAREYEFFPLRAYDDFNDRVFDFDAYMRFIGAKEAKYTRLDHDYIIHDLLECKIGDDRFALVSLMEEQLVEPGQEGKHKVQFSTAYYKNNQDAVRHYYDGSSPLVRGRGKYRHFWAERAAFKVWLEATRRAYRELQDPDAGTKSKK